VLSHKTYQNQGICYVTKTFVARNEFPHVKVARNIKNVGQAYARDSVAPLRRSSAGWMPARIGRLSAGVGHKQPVTIRKA